MSRALPVGTVVLLVGAAVLLLPLCVLADAVLCLLEHRRATPLDVHESLEQ